MEPTASPIRHATPGSKLAASVGYPQKFELALRYAEEGPLKDDATIGTSDQLLLYALSQQAQHGACKEPRPSLFDTVAKAKWSAWCELGERSKMEAMFMFVQTVDEFAPNWMEWPPLGLVEEHELPAPMIEAAPTGGALTEDSPDRADGEEPRKELEGADDGQALAALADARLMDELDARLMRRSVAPPADAAATAKDVALVDELCGRIEASLDADPQVNRVRAIARAHVRSSAAARQPRAPQRAAARRVAHRSRSPCAISAHLPATSLGTHSPAPPHGLSPRDLGPSSVDRRVLSRRLATSLRCSRRCTAWRASRPSAPAPGKPASGARTLGRLPSTLPSEPRGRQRRTRLSCRRACSIWH